MPLKDEDDIVDKVIGNPAFEQMYGYYIFFRRAAIPILLFLIGLFTYTILESLGLPHDTNLIISFMVVGILLGPLINSERYLGAIMSRRKPRK